MGLGFFVNGKIGFLLESGCFNGVVKLGEKEGGGLRCVMGIHATLRCLGFVLVVLAFSMCVCVCFFFIFLEQ